MEPRPSGEVRKRHIRRLVRQLLRGQIPNLKLTHLKVVRDEMNRMKMKKNKRNKKKKKKKRKKTKWRT
ncbi:hypothetical protein RUM43_004539 [Polyplax serrata]|uniref:Uncharacterized protein n=1 Tax=Polyplax serrata TaxID=468196 RepID=A0AAN8SCT3_POLSC